jgi:cyclic pyranopterin monophosphate synthase
MSDLTHLDPEGRARMVDVTAREVTTRTATASGRVSTTATPLIRAGEVPKGDVLAVARVAGIMATKRTPDLVPLCHPIAVHGVEVAVEPADDADEVRITATVRTADRTGVEMEALTAVAVAGLTVIDMVKAIDPHAALRDVQVEAKDGGRSGAWVR